MKLRIVGWVCLALSLVVVTPIASAGEFGKLRYDYFQGTIVITGTVGHVTSIAIPEEIEGRAVTHIGPYAFGAFATITSSDLGDIKLPASLTTIGVGAFRQSRLSQIHIPPSVSEIGADAFADCKNLQKVTGLENLQRIEQNTFAGCVNLSAFEFGPLLKFIGWRAFAGCNSIGPTLTIPATVEEIGDFAFTGCDGIFKIEVLSTLIHQPTTNRMGYTFDSCDRIEEVYISAQYINSTFANNWGLAWLFPDGFIPLNAKPTSSSTSLLIKLVPTITLRGTSGGTAIVEVSGSPNGPWSHWKTVIFGDSGTSDIVVDDNGQKQFYRVKD